MPSGLYHAAGSAESAGLVDAGTFAHAVAQVAIAAGRDDTIPMLTGVRLELEGSTLSLLATDRYRAAVREIIWRPGSDGLSLQALVPARTLADTAKTLGPLGGDVTVALSRGGMGEGMIGFAGGPRRTTSRLLDPDFPKIRSLFPGADNARARVSVAGLAEVVKRVALVADRTTPVRLSCRGRLSSRRAAARRPRQRSARMRVHRRGADRRVQPPTPARRAWRAGHGHGVDLVYDRDEASRDLPAGEDGAGAATGT
jgi:hypothetical protein